MSKEEKVNKEIREFEKTDIADVCRANLAKHDYQLLLEEIRQLLARQNQTLIEKPIKITKDSLKGLKFEVKVNPGSSVKSKIIRRCILLTSEGEK